MLSPSKLYKTLYHFLDISTVPLRLQLIESLVIAPIAKSQLLIITHQHHLFAKKVKLLFFSHFLDPRPTESSLKSPLSVCLSVCLSVRSAFFSGMGH